VSVRIDCLGSCDVRHVVQLGVHCLITVVFQKETRMREHYEHVVVELLALATECDLRSGEIGPGYPLWKILGDNVMCAILQSIEGVISESELDWLADMAGERAVALVDSSTLEPAPDR
jgi:hypothetical protein